jgi:hypothetical protein
VDGGVSSLNDLPWVRDLNNFERIEKSLTQSVLWSIPNTALYSIG